MYMAMRRVCHIHGLHDQYINYEFSGHLEQNRECGTKQRMRNFGTFTCPKMNVSLFQKCPIFSLDIIVFSIFIDYQLFFMTATVSYNSNFVNLCMYT